MDYVAYIVYGPNDDYFLSAKFSIMSLLANNKAKPELIVLTDRPKYFLGTPVTIEPLSEQQKEQWSLNGKYHFRIKNRGLAYIINKLQLNPEDRIIALDTDTYFDRPLNPIFEKLNHQWSTIFRNEGNIRNKRRFAVFRDALVGKTFTTPGGRAYSISENAEMWGTLLCGFQISNKQVLDIADDIMLCLLDHVHAHTIEPFALAEAIKAEHNLFESKDFVRHYSTSGKKRHAIRVLNDFFQRNSSRSFDDLVNLSSRVKLTRNIIQFLQSRYERYNEKL